MKPRELCEKAWQEIASKFPDFKVVSKGQKLKKTSKNKDLIFEIYFQAVNDTLRMYKNDDIRMYNSDCITDTIVEVITTCNTYTLLTVHLL